MRLCVKGGGGGGRASDEEPFGTSRFALGVPPGMKFSDRQWYHIIRIVVGFLSGQEGFGALRDIKVLANSGLLPCPIGQGWARVGAALAAPFSVMF